MRLVQETKGVQELLSKHPHKRGTQPSELILLDQLVKVDAEQFETQTEVLPVNEGILQPKEMMVVVLVKLVVELQDCEPGAYVEAGSLYN